MATARITPDEVASAAKAAPSPSAVATAAAMPSASAAVPSAMSVCLPGARDRKQDDQHGRQPFVS